MGLWVSTRRDVRVVFWKGHLCFQVAAIVEGVGVEDQERDVPFEDVFVVELCASG